MNLDAKTLYTALIKSAIAMALLTSLSVKAEWQALPDVAPSPKDNPTTAEKVVLGKMLFMDPRKVNYIFMHFY